MEVSGDENVYYTEIPGHYLVYFYFEFSKQKDLYRSIGTYHHEHRGKSVFIEFATPEEHLAFILKHSPEYLHRKVQEWRNAKQ